MLTVIAYHPTGYEVRIEVESEKLDTTIRWLEKHGYQPVRDMSGTREPDTAGRKPERPLPAASTPATKAPATVTVTKPGNGRNGKTDNGPGVAALNDDLFGDG